MDRRKRTRWGNFFWISPAPLLASVNDKIVKGLDDLINEVRPRWIAAQRAAGRLDQGLAVRGHAGQRAFSFLLVGDPGEQDASQYAVVSPLLEVGHDTDFMLIDSDVIYPAGDINDYVDGFYLPYERYRGPIYAIPGNHDWYDGLNGFMFHFCGAEPLPPIAYRAGSYTWKERLARNLWRKPSPADLPVLLYERQARAQLQQEREDAVWKPAQPAPYFTIEAESLLIVCIDTGITGKLDREQGEWLRDVSRDERPKLLVTGKPIYVDGDYHPGEIDWGPQTYPGIAEEVGRFQRVDDIVLAPEHRYVAVVGGDVHNYQRYSVLVNDAGTPDEGPAPGPDSPPESLRRIEYVVSGGGGAYLSATHRFGRVDLDPTREPKRGDERLPQNIAPITEDDFWCYPLRGDSLARFVRRFAPGFAATLAGAAVLVVVLLAVFFVWLDGFDQRLEQLDDVRAWKAILVAPLTLAVAGGIFALGVWASNRFARGGYRTLTATTLTAALGVLVVLGANLILDDAWDAWVWRMAVSSLLAVALPIGAFVAYNLLRDFLASSVRAGIGLAIAIAVVAVFVGSKIDVESEELLLVGASLAALWLGVLVIGALRRPPPDPKDKEQRANKLRLRAGRLIPATLGGLGLLVALVALRDEGWLPTGVVTAFGTVLFLGAVFVLVTGALGIRAAPWLAPGRIDPDMTAKWLSEQVGVDPVRASARAAQPDPKTKALARMTYSSWPYRMFLSELAEATTPPFFKSFLRVDVDEGELVITAYGVSGWPEDEAAPTVEDRVTIAL
jgi:MFS family permease